MKKLIIIICMALSMFNCKAQIMPLDEATEYFNDEDRGIPDSVTAIKDLNNKLDEFIGTWSVSFNNNNYQFIITKYESTLVDIPLDILLLKYKITNQNGLIIDDTTLLTDDSLRIIRGQHFTPEGDAYIASYYGENFKCGQGGDIIINIDNDVITGDKMFFKFSRGRYHRARIQGQNDCVDQINFPFPINTYLTLTKQ